MNLKRQFFPSSNVSCPAGSILFKTASGAGLKKFAAFGFTSSPEGEERGLIVEGVLTAEERDAEGLTLDYASSKPHFLSWSETCQAMSGGKSLGNLRGQHSEQCAAGKLLEMAFDDAKRAIRVKALVTDPISIQKVAEGVYNGFSIGAATVRRWNDGRSSRYEARPFEASLVDYSSVPSARGFLSIVGA